MHPYPVGHHRYPARITDDRATPTAPVLAHLLDDQSRPVAPGIAAAEIRGLDLLAAIRPGWGRECAGRVEEIEEQQRNYRSQS